MSESFDPYHKWLGIPPPEQPPNHYRLLGVTEFESDPDVIEAAANQRMVYLHDLSAGPHVADSQRLLNEVAAARHVLLDADARAAYDAELRTVPESTRKATGAPTPGFSGWMWIASGAVFATVIAGIVFAMMRVNQGGSNENAGKYPTGTLILNWPLNQREEAYLEIDGREKTIEKSESLEFELEEGRHDLVLERKGHRLIRESVNIKRGGKRILRLDWKKAAD